MSYSSIGLWRAFRLPVPVRDRLEVADRPYLRPLVTLLDEFESYLVVLIDAGTARFIEARLGTAEEVAEEIVDEALKETFPASDPPFWMPQGVQKRVRTAEPMEK